MGELEAGRMNLLEIRRKIIKHCDKRELKGTNGKQTVLAKQVLYIPDNVQVRSDLNDSKN